MLQTLDLHRRLLQAGHEDARRLAKGEPRPGYLLDFELIFRYMFRADLRPDLVQEMQYLFDHHQTTFVIGPGTLFEITQFLHSAGFVIHASGDVEDMIPSGGRDRTAFGLDEDTVKHGVLRLSHLLDAPNIQHYSDLMPEPVVDEQAFATAKAVLDTRRQGRASINANRSDALNLAAVIHLRKYEEDLDTQFYPYLLTATKPLLYEGGWGGEVAAPVSRAPSDAIYTEVLLDVYKDPVEAASHTVEVAYNAAALERDLRRAPAYLAPQDFQREPEWERALEDGLISDELRAQIEQLASFVSDPVVIETQHIYDNVRLASVSMVQQRGAPFRNGTESPRKLFDLIVEISAALNADTKSTGLAGLWRAVLDLHITSDDESTTYALIDRGPHRRPTEYLAVEHYRKTAERPFSGDQFVLRWPSSLDAASVIDSFSRAFCRHKVTAVDLIVGTDQEIAQFEAELPIQLSDVVNAISQEHGTDEEGGPTHQLRWVRMGSTDFDLYADVSPPGITHEPLVGVFVDTMRPEHLEDLYVRTSARFLLPAWLKSALDSLERETRDAG
jgi:hypothetical protein